MLIDVWFDGSCGPTATGTAAYGFLIKDEEGNLLHSGHGRVGHGPLMSSNVAEFEGLYQSMLYVQQHYPDAKVTFRGDSALVIGQMRGESKARRGRYVPFYLKTIELAYPYIETRQWTFQWVQRALNSEADELSQYQRY